MEDRSDLHKPLLGSDFGHLNIIHFQKTIYMSYHPIEMQSKPLKRHMSQRIRRLFYEFKFCKWILALDKKIIFHFCVINEAWNFSKEFVTYFRWDKVLISCISSSLTSTFLNVVLFISLRMLLFLSLVFLASAFVSITKLSIQKNKRMDKRYCWNIFTDASNLYVLKKFGFECFKYLQGSKLYRI